MAAPNPADIFPTKPRGHDNSALPPARGSISLRDLVGAPVSETREARSRQMRPPQITCIVAIVCPVLFLGFALRHSRTLPPVPPLSEAQGSAPYSGLDTRRLPPSPLLQSGQLPGVARASSSAAR